MTAVGAGGFCAHALFREYHQQFFGFVEIGQPSFLLGCFGNRNKVARNLIEEIEKPLTGFDLGGQSQPRLFERGEVIPDYRRSRVASYLCTVTCMLATFLWIAWGYA